MSRDIAYLRGASKEVRLLGKGGWEWGELVELVDFVFSLSEPTRSSIGRA